MFSWLRGQSAQKQIEKRVEEIKNTFCNENLTAEAFNQLWELSKPQLILWGASVLVAQMRIIKGDNRKTVLKDLGNKVLPNTKGGQLLSTPEQKIGLKVSYEQLKECIKEIRIKLDVPLIDSPGYYWNEDKAKDIIEFFPDVLGIFNHKELKLITAKPSISETAAGIIARRIKMAIGRPIAPRTIRNIIESLPTNL